MLRRPLSHVVSRVFRQVRCATLDIPCLQPAARCTHIQTDDEFNDFITKFKAVDLAAFYCHPTPHASKDKTRLSLSGMGVYFLLEGTAYFYYLHSSENYIKFIDKFKQELLTTQHTKLITHNLKEALAVLNVEATLDLHRKCSARQLEDLMLLAYVCHAGEKEVKTPDQLLSWGLEEDEDSLDDLPDHLPEFMTKRVYKASATTESEVVKQHSEAIATRVEKFLDIYQKLDETLERRNLPPDGNDKYKFVDRTWGLKRLYQEVELPLAVVLHDMTQVGVRINEDKLKEFDAGYVRNRGSAHLKLEAYSEEVDYFGPLWQPFNPNSPTDIQYLLRPDVLPSDEILKVKQSISIQVPPVLSVGDTLTELGRPPFPNSEYFISSHCEYVDGRTEGDDVIHHSTEPKTDTEKNTTEDEPEPFSIHPQSGVITVAAGWTTALLPLQLDIKIRHRYVDQFNKSVPKTLEIRTHTVTLHPTVKKVGRKPAVVKSHIALFKRAKQNFPTTAKSLGIEDKTAKQKLGELESTYPNLKEMPYWDPVNIDAQQVVNKWINENSNPENLDDFQRYLKWRKHKDVVATIKEYRANAKMVATYTDGISNHIYESQNVDGSVVAKVHSVFDNVGTVTGRLSSAKPNMQNAPKHKDKHYRAIFVPACPNNKLILADYAQVELRILADVANEGHLLQVFRDGGDPHKATAAVMFNKPQSEVEPHERQMAKTVNFGVSYGMGPTTLSQEFGFKKDEAEKFVESYFTTYKNVKEYMDRQKEQDHQHAEGSTGIDPDEAPFTCTKTGRRCHVGVLRDKNLLAGDKGGAERFGRQSVNAPIQGTSADIIKIAMNNTWTKLKEGSYKSRLLLQIHDELVLDCPEDEVEEVKRLVQDEMERVGESTLPITIPLTVEAKACNALDGSV